MIVIVGIGSPHGDDQIGWIAIDRLRTAPPPEVHLHQVGGGIDLLPCLEGHEIAILIDAAEPAGHPGTIRSFVWPCPELAKVLPWSTHGIGVVEALQLAESLGQLLRAVFLYTIEAGTVAPNDPPSPAVLAQLDFVLGEVRRLAAHSALRHGLAGPGMTSGSVGYQQLPGGQSHFAT